MSLLRNHLAIPSSIILGDLLERNALGVDTKITVGCNQVLPGSATHDGQFCESLGDDSFASGRDFVVDASDSEAWPSRKVSHHGADAGLSAVIEHDVATDSKDVTDEHGVGHDNVEQLGGVNVGKVDGVAASKHFSEDNARWSFVELGELGVTGSLKVESTDVFPSLLQRVYRDKSRTRLLRQGFSDKKGADAECESNFEARIDAVLRDKTLQKPPLLGGSMRVNRGCRAIGVNDALGLKNGLKNGGHQGSSLARTPSGHKAILRRIIARPGSTLHPVVEPWWKALRDAVFKRHWTVRATWDSDGTDTDIQDIHDNNAADGDTIAVADDTY